MSEEAGRATEQVLVVVVAAGIGAVQINDQRILLAAAGRVIGGQGQSERVKAYNFILIFTVVNYGEFIGLTRLDGPLPGFLPKTRVEKATGPVFLSFGRVFFSKNRIFGPDRQRLGMISMPVR